MARYNITATRIVNYSLVVEAPSEAEAITIAEGMAHDNRHVFSEVGGEFTIDYADEISE